MEFIEPLKNPPAWGATQAPAGTVSWLVPNFHDFDTFTRLFHPISEDPDSQALWRDVALSNGMRWHPEVQFESIAEDHGPQRPLFANLGRRLIGIVMKHAVDEVGFDTLCTAALSDTKVWTSPMSDDLYNVGRLGVSVDSMKRAARLTGPPPLQRTYRCFNIHASDVSEFGLNIPGHMFVQMQPTLVIAQDASFCLVTDPDYDSTILASTKALQDRVLRDDDIEALAISPGASLLYDADRINARHGRHSST